MFVLSFVDVVPDSCVYYAVGVIVKDTRYDLTSAVGQSDGSPTGPSLVEMLNWEF